MRFFLVFLGLEVRERIRKPLLDFQIEKHEEEGIWGQSVTKNSVWVISEHFFLRPGKGHRP
jgi:hypothetical protein